VNLTIVSGNISASSSSNGSGIGSGSATGNGSSTVGALSLLGGTIRANGTLAGIGSGGDGGEVGRVVFSGTIALICNAAKAKFPVNASSILLSNASLIFGTDGDRLFGSSPSREGWLELTILYGRATSREAEAVSGLNAAFLQIGNLSFSPPVDLEGSPAWRWIFCVSGSGDEQCSAMQCSAANRSEKSGERSDLTSVYRLLFDSGAVRWLDWRP
jgi:hypothetical protein